MASSKQLRLAAFALVSAAIVPGAFVAACSSDNNGNPVPPVPTYVIEAGSPDATTNTGDDSSTGGDDTADAKEEPRVLIPEDASAVARRFDQRLPAPGAPASDAGCWNCLPQTDPQFLNHCAGTGVQCAPFDNLSRSPRHKRTAARSLYNPGAARRVLRKASPWRRASCTPQRRTRPVKLGGAHAAAAAPSPTAGRRRRSGTARIAGLPLPRRPPPLQRPRRLPGAPRLGASGRAQHDLDVAQCTRSGGPRCRRLRSSLRPCPLRRCPRRRRSARPRPRKSPSFAPGSTRSKRGPPMSPRIRSCGAIRRSRRPPPRAGVPGRARGSAGWSSEATFRPSTSRASSPRTSSTRTELRSIRTASSFAGRACGSTAGGSSQRPPSRSTGTTTTASPSG